MSSLDSRRPRLDAGSRRVVGSRLTIALASPIAGGLATLASAATALTMVTSLTLSHSDATVGTTIGGKLTVDSAPPGGGVVITLSSSNPNVLAVPTSVTTTAATPRTATFSSRARGVGCATVLARSGQSPSRGAMLAVYPAPAPAGSWAQASLASRSVRGGTPATLILKATQVLVGNFHVALSTDNAAVVSVPASVTVPTTGQEVKVELPTQPVTSTTCAVITAAFGSNTAIQVLLKVTP